MANKRVMSELNTTEYNGSNLLKDPPNLSKYLSFCSIFEGNKLFKIKWSPEPISKNGVKSKNLTSRIYL